MSQLEKVVAYDTLVVRGALELFGADRVRRWFGEGDEITVAQALRVPAPAEVILRAVLRESLVGAPVLHQIAIDVAGEVLARHRRDHGTYVDFRTERALAAKQAWLDGRSSAGEVAVAAERAARAARDVALLDDPRATAITRITGYALAVDADEAVSQAYHSFIAAFGTPADHAWLIERATERLAVAEDVTPVGTGAGGPRGDTEGRGEYLPQLTPTDGALPVGTILAYAGRFPDDAMAAGWWPCDGRPAKTTGELGELFAAIGFAFGQPAHDEFNLPDLRGQFLRGVVDDRAVRDERDPSWAERRPAPRLRAADLAGPGGIGSRQPYGTATPRQPFRTSVSHLNIKKWTDDAGCAGRPGHYNDDVTSFPAEGGDRESRPVNKYVHHLIKARRTTGGEPVSLPVGVLAAFAGQSDAAGAPGAPHWRICHGAAVSTVDAPELFDALSFVHGGVDRDTFVLPDYRGWFLRGVSGTSGRDPEAEQREWPHPTGERDHRGFLGNAVGSAQQWATGGPQNPFVTKVSHLPTSDASKLVGGNLWDLLKVEGGSKAQLLTASGGDAETRPANVAVDWYVLARERTADPRDLFPVGAVAAMGGPLEANRWWLPCDGASLAVAGNEALYAAIGTTYGGDATTFSVPDLRGRFLRGASHDAGIDPDVTSRTAAGVVPVGGVGTFQDWATGRPRTSFTGQIPNLPSTTLGAHGYTNGGNAGDDGSLTIDTCTEGGDPDTRPTNVNVAFYIRAR